MIENSMNFYSGDTLENILVNYITILCPTVTQVINFDY